jgi:hypothetical protein
MPIGVRAASRAHTCSMTRTWIRGLTEEMTQSRSVEVTNSTAH